MNPRVKKVIPEENYILRVTFANGEVRKFDVKPYLDKGMFKELKNISAFRAVRPAFGTIQWRGGQDLCPDTIYEESVPAERRAMPVIHESRSGYVLKTRKRKR